MVLISGGLGMMPVSPSQWGGLLLTLLTASFAILLCFPLGVLLALGRRSDLPLLRWSAVIYIEFIRGAPLITLLFLGQNILGFLLPGGLAPDRIWRAAWVLTFFAAAYLAEAVRSGLAAVPKGQVEAARSLGLSYPQTLVRVILPQALRVALPAMVGQFISLLQDTTLLSLIGLLELLGVARTVMANPEFLGHNAEVYLTLALLFWSCCAALGLGSRALEKRLDPQTLSRSTGVEKWYPNGYHALRGVDLTVHRGEVVVVMGPSGSGKSTFIRTFNALEDFQKGTIRIDGNSLGNDLRQIDAIRREVGMVFQQFNLFPHLTVLDNLVLAPTLVRGRPRAEVQAQALNLLNRVGIKEQAQKFPGQLSGGQQQRVAIARALCMEPRILLFDEPTSSLDPEMVREVLDVMRQLAQEDITMVVVTHEVKFAEQVADRVVLMAEGSVVEEAPPAIFFKNPKHERTRRFLDQIL
jgi:His/Glu/Gln/Arg/opine family amino acid ABC transporter permease subunit